MSDEAEKAWDEYNHYHFNDDGDVREAFMSGRASRDAEVVDAWKHADEGAEYTIQSLRERIRELEAGRDTEQRMLRDGAKLVETLRDEIHRCYTLEEGQAEEIWSLRVQLAEREAVIERLKQIDRESSGPDWPGWNALNAVWKVINASPSASLAAVKREWQARAWDEGWRAMDKYIGRLEDAAAAGQGVMIYAPKNPYREGAGQ